MKQVVGLDFGTTNSAIAVATGDGAVRLATFQEYGKVTETFRSILYFFHPLDENARGHVVAGPHAVEAYFASEPRGRFMQSLKSFLASRSFEKTQVFRSRYTLEGLIAIIIEQLLQAAERQFGAVERSVILGRPARFSGAATTEDDGFAIERLSSAVLMAGFENVTFEYEPVAAAFSYEQQLDHDELVLIVDFGGGTSDFSILEVGPSKRKTPAGQRTIIGTDGVAIAGNDFDSRLLHHLVAPELGRGTEYASNGKLLPVPIWVYKGLERWHQLSFLKNQQTLTMLEQIQVGSLAPDKIAGLIHVIEGELGYTLYKSIENTKIQLSNEAAGMFSFDDPPVLIGKMVKRAAFEKWIAPYVSKMNVCVDDLLARCGLAVADIDSVFMTGGSSFVPAVRQLFEGKFGADRLRSGHELTSVAEGLGLRALTLL